MNGFEKTVECFQKNNCIYSNRIAIKSTMTIFKASLLLLAINLVSCIKEESYGCVNCMSVAFRIELQDSQDNLLIADAKIIAINKTHRDTIVVDSLYLDKFGGRDSAGHYVIYGIPGEYTLNISHPLYKTFLENSIYVTQWTEVTCEHANTENLIIKLERLQLNKSSNKKSNGILSQITKGHC